MKKKYLMRGLTDYIIDNRLQYSLVLITLISGVIVGSVSAVAMSAEKYDDLSSYINNFVSVYNLQPVNSLRVFQTSMYNNIKIVLFLWLSSLWVGFIPFAFLQMGIKGYKMGFSTAFLIQIYRGKGVIFAAMSVMPQVMILIPALTVYTVFSIKYALSLHKIRGQGNSFGVRKDMYLRSLLCIVGIVAVLTVCSLVDAFVVPPVLRPICSFLSN